MSECIKWTGAIREKDGYGVTWHNGKVDYAQRVAIGAKPGEVVMHSCDNRACVNPEHLSIGTHKKNSEDMVAKGRQCRGVKHHTAKLTEEQVKQVISLCGFFTSRSVAHMFGVSKNTVWSIWNKRTWRHISANQSV